MHAYQDEQPTGSKRPVLIIAVVVGLVLVIAVIAFGISFNNKADRGVKAIEKVSDIAVDTKNAVAPLGHEAVDKGVEIVQHVDGKDLGDTATKSLKEVSTEATAAGKEVIRKAKERAVRALEKDKKNKEDKEKDKKDPESTPEKEKEPPAEKPPDPK